MTLAFAPEWLLADFARSACPAPAGSRVERSLPAKSGGSSAYRHPAHGDTRRTMVYAENGLVGWDRRNRRRGSDGVFPACERSRGAPVPAQPSGR